MNQDNAKSSSGGGLSLVTLVSGIYAFVKTPSFHGLKGVFAASMTGMGTSVGSGAIAGCGAVAGGASAGIVGAFVGAVAFGISEGEISAKKAERAWAGRASKILDYKLVHAEDDSRSLKADLETLKVIRDDRVNAISEARREGFKRGAMDGAQKGGVVGLIAGGVLGGVGGFVYGVPTAYHLAHDMMVHGTEHVLAEKSQVAPANDNVAGQKLIFDAKSGQPPVVMLSSPKP